MRHDLLALTEDDLIAQSNRGIVNRQAAKDLEKLTCDIHQAADGTVTAAWSDGVTVILAPEKTLLEVTRAENAAADKVSRQVVRSVLAYQNWVAAQASEDNTPTHTRDPHSPWNPGDIGDERLKAAYTTAKFNAIQRDYEAGHVIEVVKSAKPSARIHTLSLTVRFMVPDDFRYSVCDCDEPTPCSHVPMAIRAFRELPDAAMSRVIETQREAFALPESLLDDLHTALLDFAELGLSGASEALMRRFQRLAQRCADEGLMWPAEILRDLITLYNQYHAHDSQFSAQRLGELLGELMIRLRAIRTEPKDIPALFIRGSHSDISTSIGSSTWVGIGCEVLMYPRGVMLRGYLQDTTSGQVFAMQKYTADPDQNPRHFVHLGHHKAMKDTTFQMIGTHRLLVKGGTRSASGIFTPKSARVSANPQNYAWDHLRAPLLAADFAEIAARRQAQPPPSLRPRRVGEDLFVCPVARVEYATFDHFTQSVFAVLVDANGAQATLMHPYTSRGAAGTEKLLRYLHHHGEAIRYIAGTVETNMRGLVFHPVNIIFEIEGERRSVQPWVDHFNEAGELTGTTPQDDAVQTDPVHYYPSQMVAALGDLLVAGLSRVDDARVRQWEQWVAEGTALGFDRLLAPIQQLSAALIARRSSTQWAWRDAAAIAFEALLLMQFAREQSAAHIPTAPSPQTISTA